MTATNSNPPPRNANEAHIVRAREGMSKADTFWSTDSHTQKGAAPASPACSTHVSGLGTSSVKTVQPEAQARKVDDFRALPASVMERAKTFDAGQRALLVAIYERYSRTGGPVPITNAEAAAIMRTTTDKAGRFIDALTTYRLIARQYSRLGAFAGFVPAIGA